MLMPLSFWGWWSAGIAVIGLIWLAWWSASVYAAGKDSIKAPEEVWDDDLSEGNDEPPKWWFYSLFAALIFSAGYIILYPGLGDNTGLLKWSQLGQFSAGMENYRARTEQTHRNWLDAPLSELAANASAMASARRLYANNCAACHGTDAAGQAGLFPDIADDIWHWGNSEEQLLATLHNGRNGVMPAHLAIVGESGVELLADYVLAMQKNEHTDSSHDQARSLYATSCAACHGVDGAGNQALGAPGFVNHKWVYVKDGENPRPAIIETIANGRNGVMPAQGERLSESQIRVLAAWLSGGMQLAPPR